MWPHQAKIQCGPVRGRCFLRIWERSWPREVLDALLVLGQACNDAGLAVLDAQTQFAQAAEGLWRCWDHTNIGDALGRVAEDRFAACRDHVERLTAVYAWAAAQYATCAVQAASRVADGEPASVPSLAVLPSDVLLLSQIHVPLLQIPDRRHRGAGAAGCRARTPPWRPTTSG